MNKAGIEDYKLTVTVDAVTVKMNWKRPEGLTHNRRVALSPWVTGCKYIAALKGQGNISEVTYFR